MAGCSHIFKQDGCMSCIAASATTVRDHVAVGNMYAAAQLDQMARQSQLQQQQTVLMATQVDEQRRFQIASWSQTPDGKAFTAWTAGAHQALHALDKADSFWRGAWYDAIEERAGKDAMEPRQVPFGRVAHGLGLAFVLLIVNGFSDEGSFFSVVSALGIIAALVVAVVVPLKQRGINKDAAARRTAVYGFDIVSSGPPSWAVGRDPAEIRSAVGSVLSAGPGAFPSARSLPSLELPSVQTGGWPAPIDGEAAVLAGIVENDGHQVAGAVRALTEA